MAKKKTLAELYAKELKRIERFLEAAEKRGYKFDITDFPKTPKRITRKALEKIQQVKPKQLYKQSKYYDIILDKWVSGDEEQHLIRSRAQKRRYEYKKSIPETDTYSVPGEPPRMADNVLLEVLDIIDTWTPSELWSEWFTERKREDKNKIKNMLNGAITTEGRNVVAYRLELRAIEAPAYTRVICYDSSGENVINEALLMMSRILFGRNMTREESELVSEYLGNIGEF